MFRWKPASYKVRSTTTAIPWAQELFGLYLDAPLGLRPKPQNSFGLPKMHTGNQGIIKLPQASHSTQYLTILGGSEQVRTDKGEHVLDMSRYIYSRWEVTRHLLGTLLKPSQLLLSNSSPDIWKFNLPTCNNLDDKFLIPFLSSHPGSWPGHCNAQPQALGKQTCCYLCLCKSKPKQTS